MALSNTMKLSKGFFRTEILFFLFYVYCLCIAVNLEDKKSFIIINCRYYTRTLRLSNLHCNKTDNDNNTKLDKTFLTVDNGSFHILGPESMMDGSDWNIDEDIQFNKKAKITLFDEDLVRNLSTTKHFKTHIVVENKIHTELKKISFATNNSNYVLTYEIV